MENTPGGATAPEAGAETARMNFAQRLAGIYFEPTKTFADINRKGSWLGIFIIMSLVYMGMSYTTTIRIDRETRLLKGFEMSPIKLSEEQKQAALKAALEKPPGFMERFSYLFTPVGLIITYLILAAVFLLIFVLMGAGITFKKSLSVAFWAMGPPAIIFGLLNILVLFVKDPDKLEVDPTLNVASNLGVLVSDQKAHPVLASMLSSMDVFSFWDIALLSIGFAAVSEGKLTAKKAATGVLVLWAVWVLGKAGFKAIFS